MIVLTERLEGRTLFASANLAPSTLAGSVLGFDGFGATINAYTLSATDTRFTFTPSFPGSDGNWSYTRTGPSSGYLFVYSDTGSRREYWLAFTSRTGGRYEADVPGLTWAEEGNFTLAGFDDLVQLESGVLRISGTFGPDHIGVGGRDGSLLVTHNNTTRSFDASAITLVSMELGDGNDAVEVLAGVGPVYALGGAGNDSLLGGDGNDTLTGSAGRDFLAGGAGDDRLNGSAHNDTLRAGAGADRLYGGDGADYLSGASGVDRLFAGTGNDTLLGNGSNDKLYGEDGDDILLGGTGADLVDGGPGEDAAEADAADFLTAVEVLPGG